MICAISQPWPCGKDKRESRGGVDGKHADDQAMNDISDERQPLIGSRPQISKWDKMTFNWCNLCGLVSVVTLALMLGFHNAVLPIVTRAVLAPIIPIQNLSNEAIGAHHSCFAGDSDCPPCPPGRDVSVTSLLQLSHFPAMQQHVFQAQEMIWTAAPSERAIIRMENLSMLHSSLNYWCCHTPDEQSAIVKLVRRLEWYPIPLTINSVSCNLDHDNQTVYILSIYDDESQAQLWTFVQRIENAMRAAGIPVINPRHQAFHSTLARVSAEEYPVDVVVPQIHQTIHRFASFNMTVFEIAGQLIYAQPFT